MADSLSGPVSEPDLDPSLPLIERPSTRLLVLDESGSLLLFRASTPAGMWLWFPPGGGLEPGESYEAAGQRELWEETGQRLPLGPHVWTRDVIVPWEIDGRPVRLRGVERYHLVRAARFDPAPGFIDTLEGYMRDEGWFRWWSLDEIVAHTGYETFVPRSLGTLLAPLLAGDLPPEPLEVGL